MKTTTQPKKRGRPVGSKTKVLKFHNLEKGHKDIVTFSPQDFIKDSNILQTNTTMMKGDYIEIPDSEATVEQVRNAGKWLGLEEPTNYWKYACITILLGIVIAMILSTPTIISLFDACVQ